MEELNKESKLGVSSALGPTIPYYFGAATGERGTVPCITTLLLPQPQRDLQHAGVTWHELGAARTPDSCAIGQREQPGESWLLGAQLGFVLSSTIAVQPPESRTHLT